ncbi:MAG TPA: hypothetical protein VGQ70_03075, partial [Candidatus Udaeobacter sp.]|nr:hypothetical protein [Candidatus Udaeobacter sp.]
MNLRFTNCDRRSSVRERVNRISYIANLSLLLCILLRLLTISGHAADVHFQFELSTRDTGPLTNRPFFLLPTNSTPRPDGTYIVTSDRTTWKTDSNASLTISNMVTSVYLCLLRGPYKDTAFFISVPDTNALLEAADLMSSVTNNPDATSAYSKVQSDLAYVRKINSYSFSQTASNLFLKSLSGGSNIFHFGATAGAMVTTTDGSNFFA